MLLLDGDAASRRSPGSGRSQARSQKVAELVARAILHDIVQHQLEPGTKLPSESEMVASYGVGRASLREALRILEIQGLIRIKQGQGGGPAVGEVLSDNFARMSTMYFYTARATLRELFEARLILETEMASYAAQRQDPRLIAALQDNLNLAEGLGDESAERQSSVARDFHTIITGLSGNRVLDLVSRAIKDIYVERVRSFPYPPETQLAVHNSHRLIVQAIVAGDAPLAGTLMRQHMQDYLQRSILANAPGFLEEVVDWR
jgi:GntR family transcriptional regulator, transcriptional repressor for pyruvate dehydrogenase complex